MGLIWLIKGVFSLYIKMAENTDLTYHLRNKDLILNKAKDYYKNNKERSREQARDQYKSLSEVEKNKRREYGKNRYHSMFEEKRQRQRISKNYYETKKSQYNNE